MRALLVGLVTLALFGLFLSGRWLMSDEFGCELNLDASGAQLGCGSTLVSRTFWCEVSWAFTGPPYYKPPAGYCLYPFPP